MCVVVKAKARSEWSECEKDLGGSASETNDSILFENAKFDKGTTENKERISSQMYL